MAMEATMLSEPWKIKCQK